LINVLQQHSLIFKLKKSHYKFAAYCFVLRFADLDGNNRHVLSISASFISQPYGLSVFENSVYWSDWNYKSINRADKWTGDNALTLINNLPIIPYDIKIVHPLRDRYG